MQNRVFQEWTSTKETHDHHFKKVQKTSHAASEVVLVLKFRYFWKSQFFIFILVVCLWALVSPSIIKSLHPYITSEIKARKNEQASKYVREAFQLLLLLLLSSSLSLAKSRSFKGRPKRRNTRTYWHSPLRVGRAPQNQDRDKFVILCNTFTQNSSLKIDLGTWKDI